MLTPKKPTQRASAVKCPLRLFGTLPSSRPLSSSVRWLLQLESSNIHWPVPPRLECRLHACAALNLWQFNLTYMSQMQKCHIRTCHGDNRPPQNLPPVTRRHRGLMFRSLSRNVFSYKWAHSLRVTDTLSLDTFMRFSLSVLGVRFCAAGKVRAGFKCS